jgi:hypothetical protein
MNTLDLTLLGETESIISCVENVEEMVTGNDFVTNLLMVEEFETIRTTTEDIQTLVLELTENGINFTTDDEFEALSIQLYQECKYILEVLEESIQDVEVLKEFGYIRAAVDIIRNLCGE